MAAPTHNLDDLKRRMQGAITSLKQELGGLRTGRASAGLVDHVQVDAYGTHMPLNQVATVSVPESRMLSVQVWDRSLVHAVEKGDQRRQSRAHAEHRRADDPPAHSGTQQERRKELAKVAHKYAEDARVAIRHVRRDAMDVLKKLEKDSHDERGRAQAPSRPGAEGDRSGDADVDGTLATKEKEIMTV